MRISTSMMYQTGTQNMQQLQSDLYRLQNQMSTGRRILTPSDDPVATAQALAIGQRQSVNSQFLSNQGEASSRLVELEDRVSTVGSLLATVKESAAEAINPNINDQNRLQIAQRIRQSYEQLLGLANSSDALGNHIFAGFSSAEEPVTAEGSPGSRVVRYHGDDGKRQIQVETGRVMDVSEAGSEVFFRIPQGNGSFVVTAGSAGTPNTGTGIVGSSSVIGDFAGDSYTLTYDAANSQFQVLQNGVAVAPVPYASGGDILLPPGGTAQIKISISGAPANGDQFMIAPATNQDIFTTIDQMIKALETPQGGSAVAGAEFNNQMFSIIKNLDQAFNHIMNVQTSVGARRSELDDLTAAATNMDGLYNADLSTLQDLDYTQAISDLANRQMVLEAAQVTFKQISQMSLFNYL